MDKGNKIEVLITKEEFAVVCFPKGGPHNDGIKTLYNVVVEKFQALSSVLGEYKQVLLNNIHNIKDKIDEDSNTTLKILYALSKVCESVSEQHKTKIVDSFFKGAHIMIEDGGAFYDMVKEFGGRERMSSHHRVNKAENASDIGIGDGVVLNEVLIGKTKDNKTCVQVEAHSTKTLLDIIMHLIDYILYKIIGKNVSQYGYS